MAGKQKSKKQVARDYFASLDKSIPLRDRVDDLVEYMKIQFVNGQTERVVFNYVRDDFPKGVGPDVGGDLFKKIIRYKIDQKKDADSPLWYVDESPAGRVLAILMIVDLYAEKVQHPSGEWYATNKFHLEVEDSKISFGEFESGDAEWVSKYCSSPDLLRNLLPFHSKEQLENPISWDDLLEFSKEYLSDDGVEVFNRVKSRGGSYKDAYDYLEDEWGDYYYELDKSGAETEGMPSAEGQKDTGGSSSLGGWIVALILLAFLAYVFLKPSSPPASNASESSVASESGGASVYSAGSGSSYSGSSSSIRNSMNSEQREKYDNMSSQGKAYVDDQMRQYDEYCARSSDC